MKPPVLTAVVAISSTLVRSAILKRSATLQSVAKDGARLEASYRKQAHPSNPFITFLSADLHDGSRVDLPSTLNALGHEFILAGHKLNTTNYPNVFRHPLTKQIRRLAPVLSSHVSHSAYLSESDIISLFEFYKDDDQMRTVDAFICSFPASFCEAWLPFNRTIIWWPVHRYAMGRCTLDRWQRLNDHLIASNKRGDVIAAGSVYDAEYLRYFTGLSATVLPTSALWYAGKNRVLYQPYRSEILVGPLQRSSFDRLGEMNAAGRHVYVPVKQLYSRFTLQDIASHRAVVVVPYAAVSYGITELYAMAIPLFVPTVDFLYKLGTMVDTKLTDEPYCGAMDVPRPDRSSKHPYSPEARDEASTKYWLQYADFYQMPHITQFSSWDDLHAKIEATDFQKIHTLMRVHNMRRTKNLARGWSDVAKMVAKKRTVPTSYEEALAMWGATRFQVE